MHAAVLELQEPQVHHEVVEDVSRHCMDIVGDSPTPASSAPTGPSTPSCQRVWFLLEVARYGYSRYPS